MIVEYGNEGQTNGGGYSDEFGRYEGWGDGELVLRF